jgi:hypothetical protein
VPWRRIRAGRILPWALAVVFLGTTLTNWWLLRNDRRDDARIAQVERVARDFLTALTTFSADTIDQDVRRIRGFAVGDFATQVDQTFSLARIQQIKQAKVVSKGVVRSVFVERVEGASANVFGVVDETVTNNVQGSPRSDVLRVELSMIDTSEGWRVDQVTILQTPATSGVPPGG